MEFSSKEAFNKSGVGTSRRPATPSMRGVAHKAEQFRGERRSAMNSVRLRESAVQEPGSSLAARCLIAATIIIFPLQEELPPIAGFSMMYVMFALLLVYTVLSRPHALLNSATHPVFLVSYIFLLSGFVIESLHPNASDVILSRIAQMIFGAIVIAALCQDRSMIRAAANGYIIAGVWLSALLFSTVYGTLRGAAAANFAAASNLRMRTYADSPLQNNLNAMAFIAAQGAVVALALALADTSIRRRYLYAASAFICSLGAFLPLSRSGILNLVIACLVVLMSYKGQKTRSIGLLIFLGITITSLAPDAAFSRLSFSTATNSRGRMEGRARIYTAAANHFPEFAMVGVGAGNFWDAWSSQSGLDGLGAHNSFLQVTIYWGITAVALFMAILWRAFICLPKERRDYALTLVLYGIAISLILRLMSSHTVYAKEYSLGLGLLVGTRYAILKNAFYEGEAAPPKKTVAPTA